MTLSISNGAVTAYSKILTYSIPLTLHVSKNEKLSEHQQMQKKSVARQ